MAARESAAVAHARKLITTGAHDKRKTPTEAAKIAGCDRRTIYKARWYKEYKAAEVERIAGGVGSDE